MNLHSKKSGSEPVLKDCSGVAESTRHLHLESGAKNVLCGGQGVKSEQRGQTSGESETQRPTSCVFDFVERYSVWGG